MNISHLYIRAIGMSQISQSSIEIYGAIKDDFAADSIQCPLSMSDCRDVDEYFKWIAIPSGKTSYTTYVLDSLNEYLVRCTEQGIAPQHPYRIYPNIGFMKTRVIRLLSMPDHIKSIKQRQLNFEFKKNVVLNLLSDNPTSDSKELSIICGLHIINELSYLHNGLATANDAAEYMAKDALNGDYLIRISSQTNTRGSGDCTVFSITLKHQDVISHIRYIDIHNVGVYTITNGPKGDLPLSIVPMKILQKADMKEILAELRYEPPQSACVFDCLFDLQDRGYIKVNRMIKASSQY